MAKKSIPPRKRRTREHVIADLSVHHVEGFVLLEGHTAQRLDQDYGYDLVVITYDPHGYIEAGALFVQLKAAERLRRAGSHYVFDLDIRDYNLWTLNRIPVILILYDATQNQGYWLPVQHYFQEDSSRRPKKGAKTVRVRIPATQRMDRSAVSQLRDLKNQWIPSAGGGRP
jgi:hypothetical protein